MIEEDGQFPLVAAYLREKMGGSSAAATTTANGDIPTPPEGLDVRVTAVEDVVEDAAGSVDPELRRRIEELAAREDFNSPETQEELRRLVMGAVGGYLDKNEEQERNVRPRE